MFNMVVKVLLLEQEKKYNICNTLGPTQQKEYTTYTKSAAFV